MLVNDKETASKLLDSIEMVCGYCPRESDLEGTGGDCETCNVRKLFELIDVSFWDGYHDMEELYRKTKAANAAYDWLCNSCPNCANASEYFRGVKNAWIDIRKREGIPCACYERSSFF